MSAYHFLWLQGPQQTPAFADLIWLRENSEHKIWAFDNLPATILEQRLLFFSWLPSSFSINSFSEPTVKVIDTKYKSSEQYSLNFLGGKCAPFLQVGTNLPWKLGQQSAICWNTLGLYRDYGLNHIFLGIKLFFSRYIAEIFPIHLI